MSGKLPRHLTEEALDEEARSDIAFERNRATVQKGFEPKFWKVVSHIPFADSLLAGWYALTDPQTPRYIQGLLAAALAYFVMPLDLIPDFIIGLGFMDDAAVLAGVMKLVDRYVTLEHRAAAMKRLADARDEEPEG